MNVITGLSFYDSLNKLTTGTLLLLLFIPSQSTGNDSWLLFFIAAFLLGCFYQFCVQWLTPFLTNIPWMIKRAYKDFYRKDFDITELPHGACPECGSVLRQTYLMAYYNVEKNGFMMNIPILEALENFMRNMWLICLLYLIIVLADCPSSHPLLALFGEKSQVAVGLFLAFLALHPTWWFVQMKIYHLVWEGDCYAKLLNCKSKENEEES